MTRWTNVNIVTEIKVKRVKTVLYHKFRESECICLTVMHSDTLLTFTDEKHRTLCMSTTVTVNNGNVKTKKQNNHREEGAGVWTSSGVYLFLSRFYEPSCVFMWYDIHNCSMDRATLMHSGDSSQFYWCSPNNKTHLSQLKWKLELKLKLSSSWKTKTYNRENVGMNILCSQWINGWNCLGDFWTEELRSKFIRYFIQVFRTAAQAGVWNLALV